MRNIYKILLAAGLLAASAHPASGQARTSSTTPPANLPATFDAIAGYCEGSADVERCRSSERFRLMRIMNGRILTECLKLGTPIARQDTCMARLQKLFRYDAAYRG